MLGIFPTNRLPSASSQSERVESLDEVRVGIQVGVGGPLNCTVGTHPGACPEPKFVWLRCDSVFGVWERDAVVAR